jgi:threonine/homoserine/homoserine lactone efflux protein
VLNLIGLVVNGIVIVMAGRLGRMFSGRGRWSRVPRYLLGTVFAGLAVRLVADARR